MKNRELMSKGNPYKTVLIFSIPSIIAMSVNAIYNVVDKIFVGNYVSDVALGGLQVVNPITFLSFGLMVLFGLGSSTYASNKLGEKKDEEANKIFNNSIFLSAIATIVMAALFYCFRKELLVLAGATEKYYSYAEEYFSVIICGFIFQSLAYFFMMHIRAEGRPTFAMITQITGAVVNIILDYLFIVVFHMGVFGAALATVIGNTSNMVIGLLYYTVSKMHFFHFNFKEMSKINWHYILQVISIGASSYILNICSGTATIIYNKVLGKYDNALSVLAILSSLDSIFVLPCVGIRQGLLPVMGYNYGERDNRRIFSIFKVGCIYGIAWGLFAFTIINIFPSFFINLFVDGSNAILVEEATSACRVYFFGVILISLNMNASALYQATREKTKAAILSAMRQCLYLIPLIFILDAIFKGSTGVWLATPISDILSAISSLVFFIITYRYFKKTGYISKGDQNEKLKEAKIDCGSNS